MLGVSGALDGLKILDFTRVYSGPYCTMLLADLGAEVIKIEALGKGDDTRHFLPFVNEESGYFMYLNRNKRGIALDLKHPEGRSIALDLARQADIVVENFSPGTMARLGLSYDDICAVNPEIVYASITGFGQSGPYHAKVAYDGVAQAISGLQSMTGAQDGLPYKTGPAISDAASGVHAALGIMTAMYYRNQTGKGQHVDIAMMDTMFSMLENAVPVYTMTGVNPGRLGNENPASAPYDLFPTKDNYVIIATANDALFVKLTKVMQAEYLLDDPRFVKNYFRKLNSAALFEIISAWTKTFTTHELEVMLDEAKIPVSGIKTIEELVSDPQIRHRNMLVEIEHPIAGTFEFPGNPLKLSKTPPQVERHAPILGQHTLEVLREKLNIPDQELERLLAAKVIAVPKA